MYRVYGYEMDCQDFSYQFNSFILAVLCIKRKAREGSVVFQEGMSEKVFDKIYWDR